MIPVFEVVFALFFFQNVKCGITVINPHPDQNLETEDSYSDRIDWTVFESTYTNGNQAVGLKVTTKPEWIEVGNLTFEEIGMKNLDVSNGYAIQVEDHRAYFCSDGGWVIYNITDKTNPSELASSIFNCKEVLVYDNYAYVGNMNGDIRRYDLSDLTLNTYSDYSGIAINEVYGLGVGSHDGGMYIYVSDNADPGNSPGFIQILISGWPGGGTKLYTTPSKTGLSVDTGNYWYISEGDLRFSGATIQSVGTTARRLFSGGLPVYVAAGTNGVVGYRYTNGDLIVTIPTAPYSALDVVANIHEKEVIGGDVQFVFIAYDDGSGTSGGVLVYDVYDYATPILVKDFPTANPVVGITREYNYVYIIEQNYGIRIFEFGDLPLTGEVPASTAETCPEDYEVIVEGADGRDNVLTDTFTIHVECPDPGSYFEFVRGYNNLTDPVFECGTEEAIPEGREGGCGYYFRNGEIYVFGGHSVDYIIVDGEEEEYYNDIWVLLQENDRWCYVRGNKSTTFDPSVYAEVGKYEPENEVGARSFFGSFEGEFSFFVFGGTTTGTVNNNNETNELWEFSVVGENTRHQWRVLMEQNDEPIFDEQPSPRSFICAAVSLDHTESFLFGGVHTTEESQRLFYNDFWRYDIQTNSFEMIRGGDNATSSSFDYSFFSGSTIQKLQTNDSSINPPQRTGHSCWVDPSTDHFLVFGGCYANGECGNDIWIYNFTDSVWVWVAGGENNTENSLALSNNPSVYDPENLPSPRERMISFSRFSQFFIDGVDGERLVPFLGGWEPNTDRVFQDMWVFQPLFPYEFKAINLSLSENIVSDPATNTIGSRYGGIGIAREDKSLWVFGGCI